MTSYGREETFGLDFAVLKGQLAEPRAAGNGLRATNPGYFAARGAVPVLTLAPSSSSVFRTSRQLNFSPLPLT